VINVQFVYPPIPDRRFDYSATWDGYEGGDAIGYGPTPDAAINDLLENSEGDRDEVDHFKAHIERLAQALAPLLTGFKWEALTEEQQEVLRRGAFPADSIWRAYVGKQAEKGKPVQPVPPSPTQSAGA